MILNKNGDIFYNLCIHYNKCDCLYDKIQKTFIKKDYLTDECHVDKDVLLGHVIKNTAFIADRYISAV